MFDIGRSIELILAPIVGGLGTVFGPVVGAFILTPLGEVLIALTERLGINAPGAKAMFYGLTLMVIIVLRPSGVWPWLARVLGLTERAPMTPLLAVDDVSKRFRGLAGGRRRELSRSRAGEIFAVIGPNGAGKTTLFNMIAGVFAPDAGAIAFAGERIDGLPPDAICRRGIGRTFQLVRPFPALTVEDNVVDRRAAAPAATSRLRGRMRARCCAGSISTTSAHQLASRADAARPQAARGRARARDRPEAPAARRGDGRPAADRDRPHGRDPARRSTATAASPSC